MPKPKNKNKEKKKHNKKEFQKVSTKVNYNGIINSLRIKLASRQTLKSKSRMNIPIEIKLPSVINTHKKAVNTIHGQSQGKFAEKADSVAVVSRRFRVRLTSVASHGCVEIVKVVRDRGAARGGAGV